MSQSSQNTPPEHPPINTLGWIKTRLQSQSVYEEGGKWKVRFQGREVEGEFDKQADALKAYRKAAEDKWHEGAILPTDAQIDAAGDVPVPPKPGPPPSRQQPENKGGPEPSFRAGPPTPGQPAPRPAQPSPTPPASRGRK